jgi:hypothetical protein
MVSRYMRAASHLPESQVLVDVSENYDIDNISRTYSHTSLALGNALSHNFFINNFGKANFCVRPQAARLTGMHETGVYSRSPLVDWAFLSRASLAGLQIELVPDPLYEYTKESTGSIWYGMTSSAARYDGHAKILKDFDNYLPTELRDALHLCRHRLGLPTVPADGPV